MPSLLPLEDMLLLGTLPKSRRADLTLMLLKSKWSTPVPPSFTSYKPSIDTRMMLYKTISDLETTKKL